MPESKPAKAMLSSNAALAGQVRQGVVVVVDMIAELI